MFQSKAGGAVVCPSLQDGLYRLVGIQAGQPCAADKQLPALSSAVTGDSCGGHASWILKTLEKETEKKLLGAKTGRKRVVFDR